MKTISRLKPPGVAGGVIDSPWRTGDYLTAARLEALRKEVLRIKTYLGTQDTTYNPVARGGGGDTASTWYWAKVTDVNPTFHNITVKFVDDDGVAIGDAFTVSILAATTSGFTITPTLAALCPKIAVGDYVRVERRSGFRSGWWLFDLAIETCE